MRIALNGLLVFFSVFCSSTTRAESFLHCSSTPKKKLHYTSPAAQSALRGSIPALDVRPEMCPAASGSPARPSPRISTDQLLQRCKRVFHRLVGDDAKSFLGTVPQFEVTSSNRPNAFLTTQKNIRFTSSLLELIEDESELAFVIAHELGHLAFDSRSMPEGDEEISADRFAVRLLRAAGFDTRAGVRVLDLFGRHKATFDRGLNARIVELRSVT